MQCDVLVIGSGPGGYRAAVLAALRGRKAVIVEKATWGGCCLNRGCVPKKDWYHSARLLDSARHFAGRGIVGDVRGDLAQAWRHQHEVVKTVRDSYQSYLKRLGVVALAGRAVFTGPRSVVLQPCGTEISANAVIIATGSEPMVPQDIAIVPGKILHSDLLFDEPVPEGSRVLIVGGGVVGIEFAYILRQFGRDVRWVTRSDPFARSDFSSAALGQLRNGLAAVGVTPTQATIQDLSVTPSGVRMVTGTGETWDADWALLATGRRAVTDGLGLEAIGVQRDNYGFIVVDAELRTAVQGVFALGDCVTGPMTANRALYEAGIVVDNICSLKGRRRDLTRVPEAIYSAVELARVGLTEEQAEDQGLEPAIGFAAFATSPRALGQDEP
ncbi:MAG: dihydrolipoyl dehydrogenase family protein, partial [Acidiferrobacter sp.]